MYYFYIYKGNEFAAVPSLKGDYSDLVWKPSFKSPLPPNMGIYPFIFWSLFHCLHIFANREYSLFLIYHKGIVVHRSCIFPGYFRFPFMNKLDLQIGDTWTHPDFRGKGLATFALVKIVHSYYKPGRNLWYVVEENNLPSISVAEKAGFIKIGEGIRTKRLGLNILGSFVIKNYVKPE